MDPVSGLPASEMLAGGLILTTALLVVAPSWRLGLLTLLLQYVAVGSLLTRHIAPPMGGLRLIVGALVCLILYLTLRRVNYSTARETHPWLRISRTLFRLAALGLVGLGAFGTSAWQHWSHLPAPLCRAALWLIGSGLLIPLLRPTRLWTGLGSLTFVSGLGLLLGVSQPGRWWETALWSGVPLLLALAVAASFRLDVPSYSRG